MAERRRRGRDAANERRDSGAGRASATKRRERGANVPEDLADETDLDTDLETDLDTDLDETAADDAVDEDAAADGDAEDAGDDEDDADEDQRGTTKARTKPGKPEKKSSKVGAVDRPGIFGKLMRFIREIVAELRKVIWPTRSELLTYTLVVVVFVTIILTIVGFLDFGFAKAVLWVFGGKTSSGG